MIWKPQVSEVLWTGKVTWPIRSDASFWWEDPHSNPAAVSRLAGELACRLNFPFPEFSLFHPIKISLPSPSTGAWSHFRETRQCLSFQLRNNSASGDAWLYLIPNLPMSISNKNTLLTKTHLNLKHKPYICRITYDMEYQMHFLKKYSSETNLSNKFSNVKEKENNSLNIQERVFCCCF